MTKDECFDLFGVVVRQLLEQNVNATPDTATAQAA